jgi:protein gp37
MESPDTRYGRLLEAAEISGLAAQRAFEVTKELLESGEWEKLGSGFQDVNDFIRSIPFGSLNPPESLRKSYEKLASDHGATQRAIAGSAGVSHPTVGRDLKSLEPGTDEPESEDGSQESQVDDLFEAEPGTDEPEPAPAKPAPVMLTLYTHTGDPVEYPEPKGRATFNQTQGEGISWASWSWNPVTGCLHGCVYCYAREIATNERFGASFPAGFTPLFHDERLDAPANTTIPAKHAEDPAWSRVFVCSMADLYGRWVPDEWIRKVHDSMLASPQWQYILLTKFPARYVGLDLPPGAWVGTSVDEQKRVRIAEDAFRKIDGVTVKWLSLEPLLEPLQFDDLSMFDWVVIGAQTETRQPDGTVPAFMPPFEWVARLYVQAKDAGCRVHLKPNLLHKPGMQLPDEYPSGRDG